MTTNQGYAADGKTPLHNVPGRELLVSAVTFNGAVAEIARLQAQVEEANKRADALLSAALEAHAGMQAQVDALAGAHARSFGRACSQYAVQRRRTLGCRPRRPCRRRPLTGDTAC